MLYRQITFFVKFICYKKLNEEEKKSINEKSKEIIESSNEEFKGFSLVGIVWDKFKMWCCEKEVSSFKIILEISFKTTPAESGKKVTSFIEKMKKREKTDLQYFVFDTWHE